MPITLRTVNQVVQRELNHLANATQTRFKKSDAATSALESKIMNALKQHIEYFNEDSKALDNHERRIGVLENFAGDASVKIEYLENFAQEAAGFLQDFENKQNEKNKEVGKQNADLSKRCSTLEKLVDEQQTALNALNGGSKAMKMVEKSFNDSNRWWNKIAKIENSAHKILAYIGYVIFSILTLGIMPAADFLSKSFTPEMAKNFIANENKQAAVMRELKNSGRKEDVDKKAEQQRKDEAAEIVKRSGVTGSNTEATKDSTTLYMWKREKAQAVLDDRTSSKEQKQQAQDLIRELEQEFDAKWAENRKRAERYEAKTPARVKAYQAEVDAVEIPEWMINPEHPLAQKTKPAPAPAEEATPAESAK